MLARTSATAPVPGALRFCHALLEPAIMPLEPDRGLVAEIGADTGVHANAPAIAAAISAGIAFAIICAIAESFPLQM